MNTGLFTTRNIFIFCIVLWGFIVVRAMMNTKGTEDFVTTVSSSEVTAYAKAQLGALQERSFAEDQEICAVIFENSDGELGSTPLISGEMASCDIRFFDEPGMGPVASMHTHGAYNSQYDSEVPSMLDMQSDIASGVDGYVSTPGGRLWRIDAEERFTEQVCGENCLAQDPAYRPCESDEPKSRYSLDELQARMDDSSIRC